MNMKGRVSLAKYVSVRPEVLKMAEKLTGDLHVNFSQLITRLIVEAHSKRYPQIKDETQEEVLDPLA